MKPLRIALTKGRLEKTTIELLEKIGRRNNINPEILELIKRHKDSASQR